MRILNNYPTPPYSTLLTFPIGLPLTPSGSRPLISATEAEHGTYALIEYSPSTVCIRIAIFCNAKEFEGWVLMDMDMQIFFFVAIIMIYHDKEQPDDTLDFFKVCMYIHMCVPSENWITVPGSAGAYQRDLDNPGAAVSLVYMYTSFFFCFFPFRTFFMIRSII